MRGQNSRKGTKAQGRVRTLSNSELSSSAKGSNEDVNMAAAYAESDDDSWTVSHDMLMIDEVHTSEESENLSALARINKSQKIQEPSFFNIGMGEPANIRVNDNHLSS